MVVAGAVVGVLVMFSLEISFYFLFLFSLNFGLIFNMPSIFYKCRYTHIRFCMSSNIPNHYTKDIMFNSIFKLT